MGKIQTNADYIRSMSDEELAAYILNFKNTYGEEYEGESSFLEWLQEEKGNTGRLTVRSENSGMVWFKDTENNDMWCEPCEMSVHNVRMALAKLADYEDAEEQGLILRLPCEVGDTVYVDSAILPIKDMECENIDHKIPSYFPARIVSFRFAKRNWMKIAVKAKWLHEWIDNETGPESAYIDSEKKFTFSLSGIGKTVFLTESEAEAKLKEMEEK